MPLGNYLPYCAVFPQCIEILFSDVLKTLLFLASLVLVINSSHCMYVLGSRILASWAICLSFLSAHNLMVLFIVLMHFCIISLSAFCIMYLALYVLMFVFNPKVVGVISLLIHLREICSDF